MCCQQRHCVTYININTHTRDDGVIPSYYVGGSTFDQLMGSLPITYCTDFPGTNKILSLLWRDLSLNKCRVTTTRIWLGGGGGGKEIHMSHCHILPWLCWSLVPSPHTHSLYWALTQREKSANIWHLCTPFQYFPAFFGIGVIKIDNFGRLGKNYFVISHCDDTQWLPMTRHLGCL